MKTAGIVLDDWKIHIFKKHLDEHKFKYKQFSGPMKGCITLKVETKTITELQPVIQAANDEAASKKGKRNGG